MFNQFEEVYDITERALKVQRVTGELGLAVEVRNLENPRTEMGEHHYQLDHQHLFDLGYQPTQDVEAEMRIMIQDLMKYRDRIQASRGTLILDVRWDGPAGEGAFLKR